MHVLSEREEMGGYLRAPGQQVKFTLSVRPLPRSVTPAVCLFLLIHKERCILDKLRYNPSFILAVGRAGLIEFAI